MNALIEREAIGATDIIRFLAQHKIHTTAVTTYADGVASRNFRATGPGGIDLTVRCDFRRKLDMVRDDRRYADLARTQGIAGPSGPWIDGHIRNVATTARPTIEGASLAQLASSNLPAPGRIGELLAALHTVALPCGDRHFFYEGLLEASDPIWLRFSEARAAFHGNSDVSNLMEQALERLQRDASRLRAVTKMPRTLIHGDFNPPNILKSGTELILIDWEKACSGYAVADLVQAIYYFSAAYGRHGLPFEGEFVQSYTKTQRISRPILDVWLSSFPAFIFLRDTVSASLQQLSPAAHMQARFAAYLRDDSAPRFRHFLENEGKIRNAVLS